MASDIFLFVVFVRNIVAVVDVPCDSHFYLEVVCRGSEDCAFGVLVMNSEEDGAERTPNIRRLHTPLSCSVDGVLLCVFVLVFGGGVGRFQGVLHLLESVGA